MVYFIYSDETASSNIAAFLRDRLALQEIESNDRFRRFGTAGVEMIGVKGRLVDADFVDEIIEGTAIFLSRHSSSRGISAFTVHAEGNWSDDVSLGGRPKKLSVASPISMLNFLNSMNSLNDTGIELVYEATHHGPFLEHPSMFVELGGNEEMIASKTRAEQLAQAVALSLESSSSYDKVAVGFGGLHYSAKFTRLALQGKYAFAHIMPKYQIGNTDMIEAAFARSDLKPEIAIIEWKSIKAVARECIIRELSSLGIDYAKV